MKKYINKAIILSLSLVLLLSFSACNDKDAEVKEINIGYLRVPNDESVAKNQKYIDEYFNEKGIKVNYITVDSGVEANKAFASGSLDFATMGNTNGVVALATGLDTELVWIHQVIASAEGLLVREGSGIDEVLDLKGKTIATTFSSTSHYILLNVLKEAGIDKDVRLLDMQTLDIVAAWQRGDIDAAYTWEPSKTRLLENGAKVLVTSEDMIDKGFVTANIALARKSFAKSSPELVSGLIKQLIKSHKLYDEDDKKAVKVAASELEIDEDIARMQMSGSIWLSPSEMLSEKYMGSSDKRGKFADIMYDTAKFLWENKSIETVPTLDKFKEFINPYYIEKAVQ